MMNRQQQQQQHNQHQLPPYQHAVYITPYQQVGSGHYAVQPPPPPPMITSSSSCNTTYNAFNYSSSSSSGGAASNSSNSSRSRIPPPPPVPSFAYHNPLPLPSLLKNKKTKKDNTNPNNITTRTKFLPSIWFLPKLTPLSSTNEGNSNSTPSNAVLLQNQVDSKFKQQQQRTSNTRPPPPPSFHWESNIKNVNTVFTASTENKTAPCPERDNLISVFAKYRHVVTFTAYQDVPDVLHQIYESSSSVSNTDHVDETNTKMKNKDNENEDDEKDHDIDNKVNNANGWITPSPLSETNTCIRNILGQLPRKLLINLRPEDRSRLITCIILREVNRHRNNSSSSSSLLCPFTYVEVSHDSAGGRAIIVYRSEHAKEVRRALGTGNIWFDTTGYWSCRSLSSVSSSSSRNDECDKQTLWSIWESLSEEEQPGLEGAPQHPMTFEEHTVDKKKRK